jgi:hypothetical protein
VTTRARARTARLAVGLVAALAAGSVFVACGASAGDLAQASCAHVHTSLALLSKADHTADPTRAAALREQAYVEVLAAIPIAAQAAYHDIQWEALSSTLSEANRVPESELVPSLRTQCAAADSSVFNQPPPPSSAGGG